MNPVRRLADDSNDLLDADLSRIFDFERRARSESAIVYGEEQTAQERPILRVKGTVDENVPLVRHLALDTVFEDFCRADSPSCTRLISRNTARASERVTFFPSFAGFMIRRILGINLN